MTAGPAIGGWLARQYGWQAVFLFNVPVGLVALGLSLRFVPHGIPAVRGDRFDWAGAIFPTVLASAAGGTGAPVTADPAIFAATRASFLVGAALALVGVGISATRGAQLPGPRA